MEKLINLTDVSLIYPREKLKIISKMNLTICQGDIITLVGPNGGGKSSLIKMIAGMIKPTSGQIDRSPNLRIGYVPQKLNLNKMIHLLVIDFLQLQPNFNQNRLEEINQHLDVSYLLNKDLHNLSGGETQRVLLVRALINTPNLLILDEPTQGVDIIAQAKFYNHLQEINKSLGCAIVLVSHDLHTVLSNSNYVLCINRHLCCQGTPAQVMIDPIFTGIFGENFNKSIGIYQHNHNHKHHLDHSVCVLDTCDH